MKTKKRYFLLILFAALLFWSVSASAASSKFKVKLSRKNYLVGEHVQIQTSGKKVKYKFKSSKPKVISVSKKGVVTAKKKGTAVITVTGSWKVKGKTVQKTREYNVKVYNCKLNATQKTIAQSKTTQLKIKGDTLTRKITWTSSDTGVATVTSSGLVTGIRRGTAVITANVGSEKKLNCTVTINANVLSRGDFSVLVNNTGSYSVINLLAEIQKQISTISNAVYVVSDPTLGYMRGNEYVAKSRGTNSITMYAGEYEKSFTFNQIQWFAHRGYSDIRPENTIDAYKEAALSGAMIIEGDVRLTKDDVWVMMHDNTVDCMTNGTGKVRSYTYEELKGLTIDSGNGVGECIYRYVPTVDEYLKICRQYNCIAYIHLKMLPAASKTENREAAAKNLYKLICDNGMKDRCVIISYNAEIMNYFQQVNGSDIPLGALDASCYNSLGKLGATNFTDRQATKYGPYYSSEYNPVLGRSGKMPSQYHSD